MCPLYCSGKTWLKFELIWLHFRVFSLYYFSVWPALPFIYKVSSDIILLNVQSQVLPFCMHIEFLLKSAENPAKSMGTACVHLREGLCLWFLLSVDERECETIRRKYAQCGSAKDFEPQWNASYGSEQDPLIYKSKVKYAI